MRKLVATVILGSAFAIANAQADLVLVPNGDFETPAGDSWVVAGPATTTFPALGGNTGGYGDMDSTAGWGVLVSEDNPTNGRALNSFGVGLVAGNTYDFQYDIIGFAGGELAGIKLEGWDGAADVGNTGDVKINATTSWVTHTVTWTIPAAATSVKFVPLSVDGGRVGFDNIGVNVAVPEPSAFVLLALGAALLVARRRR